MDNILYFPFSNWDLEKLGDTSLTTTQRLNDWLNTDPCLLTLQLYSCYCTPSQRMENKSRAQSCLTVCNTMDCSPPGSSVHGIFQANFPGEYWSGFPFPPPGDLPDPGIKPASPVSPALQADSLPTEPSGRPVLYFSMYPNQTEGFLFFCWCHCCLK